MNKTIDIPIRWCRKARPGGKQIGSNGRESLPVFVPKSDGEVACLLRPR